MDKLKACPFCGEIESVEIDNNCNTINPSYYGLCVTGCAARTCSHDSYAGAVETWNSRPIEDSLQSTLTASEKRGRELETALTEIRDAHGHPIGHNSEGIMYSYETGNRELRKIAEKALEKS